MLEVRAVLVAVPGQLGQRARPDLAGVVGEPDDREVVVRVLRPDQRVERDRDLLGREEAAAQQHRAAHVDQQDRGRPRQLLGPVDLEVGRREVDAALAALAAGRRGVLLASQRVRQRARAGRGGTGRRTRTAWRSPRARRPARLARSDARRTRRAGAGRTGRRGPSGRCVGCRAASARAARRRGSGSPAASSRRARSSSASRSRRPSSPSRSRTRSRSSDPRSPGPSTSDRASSSRSIAARRSIWASAPSSPSGSSPAERDPLAQAAGQQQVEVARELGEVHAEPVVLEERVHHRLELGALLGRHRAQERLHRGHPRGELVDDVVEGPGAREEPAVLREELADVRVVAADPLAEELVEVAHHLAVRGEVLRAHRADRVRQALHVLVEHLPAEPVDERVEPVARRSGSRKS